jgi:hypothetical protein
MLKPLYHYCTWWYSDPDVNGVVCTASLPPARPKSDLGSNQLGCTKDVVLFLPASIDESDMVYNSMESVPASAAFN